MTLTLIVVSIVFIVLNVPSDICFLGFGTEEQDSPEITARKTLFFDVARLLSYISHSINFLMYFFSGRKFRRTALHIIRCRWFRKLRQCLSKQPRLGTIPTTRTDMSLAMSPTPSESQSSPTVIVSADSTISIISSFSSTSSCA